MRPTVGDTICGRIRIEAEAPPLGGAHAFGDLLCASTTDDNARFWLTVIERELVPSQVDLSRFMAGASALLTMRHASLVGVTLVDREADFCIIGCGARDDVRALADVLEAGEGKEHALRTAVEVARGLAYLHGQGRIHGALSPGNVVFAKGAPMLVQHGITAACDAERFAARTKSLGGDVVAPEVKRGGPFTPKIDVYSWGALMAAMLTGLERADAVASLLEEGGGPLGALARAALDPEPQTRMPDAVELLRRLADPTFLEGDLEDSARFAEVRELAKRYLDELNKPVEEEEDDLQLLRRFHRAGADVEPPELKPRAGIMELPDEPDPDPFSVAPARAKRPREPDVRLSDDVASRRPGLEPARMEGVARSFDADALTPPDGTPLPSLLAPGKAVRRLTPQAVPPPGPLDAQTGAAVAEIGVPRRAKLADSGRKTPPPVPAPGPSKRRTTPPAVAEPPPLPRAEPIAAPVKLPPAPDTGPSPLADAPTADAPESAASLDFEMEPKLREGANEPVRVPSTPMSASASTSSAAASTSASTSTSTSTSASTSTSTLAASASASGQVDVVGGGHGSHSDPALQLDTGAQFPIDSGSTAVGPEIKRVLRRPGTRGPKGPGMAAVVGIAATALAIGLTVPVVGHRGGVAPFLGLREAEAPASDEPLAVAGPDDAKAADGAAAVPEPAQCPTDMVRVEKTDNAFLCIDSGEYPGLREVPRVRVTLAKARDLCAERGRQLCTVDEWRRACRGPKTERYPYGPTYKRGTCNEARPDGVGSNLSRSGARDHCISAEGAFDLVGNVGEWVAEGAVLGGDARTRRPTCVNKVDARASSKSPSTGFRCCLTVAVQ